MTKREKAAKILDAYLDGGLPDNLSGRVRRWFSNREDRQSKDEALEELFHRIVEEEQNPKPETYRSFREMGALLGFPEEILENGTPEEPPVSARRLVLRRILIRAAAVILPLALATGTFFYLNRVDEKSAEVPYVAEMSISSSNAKEIRMPDSSHIWMNRNTILINKSEEEVELYGEAYFDITKQPENQQFKIDTKHFMVTVIGTSFNIKAYPDTNEIVVSLYEGTIDIHGNGVDIQLTEGKEMVYDKTTLEYRISDIARKKPEWMRDIINFERKPLAEVFDALEEIYGVDIVGNRGLFPDDFVSLKYEGDADLKEVMYFLSNISGKFTYSINGDRVVIQKKQKVLE